LGAHVLDRHCDGGRARSLLEVVIRPRRGGAGGVHDRCDHAAVKVDAVVGQVFPERQPNGDVVGFVALEHDAETLEDGRRRHEFTYRLPAPTLLIVGQ
jgi:hypothetical protein